MYSNLYSFNTSTEFPEPFLMDIINYSILNYKKNIIKPKENIIIHKIIHDDKKIVKIFLGNKLDYSKQHESIYDSEPTNLIIITGCNKFYDHLINDINYEFGKLYKYKKIKDSIWDVTDRTPFEYSTIINKLKNYITIDNELNKPSIYDIDFEIDTTEYIKVVDDKIELINVFNYVDFDANTKYILNNETIYSLIINLSCRVDIVDIVDMILQLESNTELEPHVIIEKNMYGFQINKKLLNVSDILRICKETGIDFNKSFVDKICHSIVDKELSYLPKDADVPVTEVDETLLLCTEPIGKKLLGKNSDCCEPNEPNEPILVYNHINHCMSIVNNNHLPEFEAIDNDELKNIDHNMLYAINQVSDKTKYINEQIEIMTQLVKELEKFKNT